MECIETHQHQQIDGEANYGDVLAVGEAVLERVKAISRHLAERVRQLTGESPTSYDSGSE
jgi:hypothetical protein